MASCYIVLSRCLFGLSFLLCVFSLILPIVGLAGKGWVVLNYVVGSNDIYTGFGMTGILMCVNEDCQTRGLFGDLQNRQQQLDSTSDFDEKSVEDMLSLTLGLDVLILSMILLLVTTVGAVTAYAFVKDHLDARNIKIIAAITFAVSGLLILLAILISSSGINDIKNTLKSNVMAELAASGTEPEEISFGTPYSMLCVGLGGILAITAALITGLEAYLTERCVIAKEKMNMGYDRVPILPFTADAASDHEILPASFEKGSLNILKFHISAL